MSNKNNNLIFSGLLLIAFAILVGSPTQANAYVTEASYPYWDGVYYTPPGPNLNPGAGSQNNATPVIYSLSPNSGIINSGVKVITINGAGFTPNSIAKFNSGDRATTYINSTRLQMELRASDMKATGKHLVTVYNPSSGTFSNTAFFTVNNGTVSGASTTGASASNSKSSKATTTGVTRVTSDATVIRGNDSDLNSVLSANASSSGSSFMPNTLLEWLFLCAIILLAVALWRKIFVTDKEAHAPLKHA